MARYVCQHCHQEFEADRDRCPTCLRTSTVQAVEAAKAESRPAAFFRWPALLVACAIIVPFELVQFRRPWWQTFLIALVGFGIGHAVDHAWRRWRRRR